MAYTEVQEKGGKKYYYRVKSTRKGDKVHKERVYLGVDRDKKELPALEKKADKELSLLSSLLTKSEVEALEKIRSDYKKERTDYASKYEAFVSLFTYDSTSIEGNTFTLQETSQLLFEGVTPRKPLREVNEVLNHKEAFDFMLGWKKDVNKEFILRLHELVIKNTLKPELDAQVGAYRTVQVYIRGVDWVPPAPSEVAKEMTRLLSWYTKNKRLHPLIRACYFHSAFEAIHPFVDGNGRVGRLLMNFILHKQGFPMINIPSKKKHVYYEVLETAQVKGNLKPLTNFLFSLLKNEKIRF